MSFSFQGDIPASKSLMNRALLLQSYFPQIQIHGNSNCDDVRHMKSAIVSLIQKKEIHCGEAGTVLRLMGFRCSRETGNFVLSGSPRLLSRPQKDLVFLLEQLSVTCKLLPDQVRIISQGWKKPLTPIRVNREASSQFASALLLNSWGLDFDLVFEMKTGVSEGYWEMSLAMAQLLGMSVHKENDFYTVPAGQKVNYFNLVMEPDYSSAFALAAAGALFGESKITNATPKSSQPDFIFVKILEQMGAQVRNDGKTITIKKPKELKAVEVDLKNSPDLFPVLAVLCAFAKGESKLKGAPHLVAKESNRLEKTAELLKKAGLACSIKGQDLVITGNGFEFTPMKFVFDPDQDHRMAMAAGLLKLMGYPVQILSPQVVNKSYPEFWKALGIQP